MTDERDQKLEELRLSIQHEITRIEACFTKGDTIADQIVRACDLLLGISNQFGASEDHRLEAISLKSNAQDLMSRERRGELSSEGFRVECSLIRRRILELASEMRAVADAELQVIVNASVGPPSSAKVVPGASRVSRVTPLRQSLEKHINRSQSDGIGFRCSGLGKRYGITSSPVIDDFNLELKNGEITGLVGLNGSGKTTLLRMIAGTLRASFGVVEYPALSRKSPTWVEIRRQVALVSQRPEPWAGTVEDALTLQAACFGDSGTEGAKRVDFFIARLGLAAYRRSTWGQLSGGYRTRFELAKAMLSRPKMLVLDEPLAALDIPAQMGFLTDLEDFATTFSEPMPVLLSSQHIYEVESIARHMVVIRDGKAIYNGPTEMLGQDRKHNGFEVSCELDIAALAASLEKLPIASIQSLGSHESFIKTDRTVVAAQVIAAIQQTKVQIRYFRDASCSTRMYFE